MKPDTSKMMHEISPDEIGFDFDGVIANTGETFIRMAEEQHNFSLTLEEITHFDVENCINMPVEIVDEIFMEIMKDSITVGLSPMHGAVQTINEITASHKMTVITARAMLAPVENWFAHHLQPQAAEKITLVAMGDHNDKVRYAREHKLTYFVDDRAETCMQLAEAQFQPIVFEQPWNRGRHHFPTVSNWADIRQLLKLNGN